MAGKHEKKRSKIDFTKRSFLNILTIVLLIIVIILLLLRSCGEGTLQDNPFGDYDVTDSTYTSQETTPTTNKTGTIAFAGFGKYKVSKQSPKIRLENPASNRVEMVFTLTDKKSGALIARTEKVQPGKYAYINVMDFYSKSGIYDVFIKITTFDSTTGQQKNGLEQTVQVQVT